ncbi:hypothetical protein VNO77_44808 [Canavalia gladiata]|uniref:Uncharacterized protein n=1 Tax=Canavalia gladiata TaxID=3824 RepID=A0AAN9JXN8_CANGL
MDLTCFHFLRFSIFSHFSPYADAALLGFNTFGNPNLSSLLSSIFQVRSCHYLSSLVSTSFLHHYVHPGCHRLIFG